MYSSTFRVWGGAAVLGLAMTIGQICGKVAAIGYKVTQKTLVFGGICIRRYTTSRRGLNNISGFSASEMTLSTCGFRDERSALNGLSP